MAVRGNITLATRDETLVIDGENGALVSFRSRHAPDQEFVAHAVDHPAFVIGYLDERRRYCFVDSREAEGVTVGVAEERGETTITAVYRRVAGKDLEARTTVRGSPAQPGSGWCVSLRNGSDLPVVDVQFPFVVCRYDLGGKPGSEVLLLPHGYGPGRLMRGLREMGRGGWWQPKLGPDTWLTWEYTGVNGEASHYPGAQFAQFLAYYNDRAGIYLSCEDTEGRVKRFKVAHREPGVRLGVAHTGDWPTQGERELEYNVVVRSFTGDWYDAADLYRDWALERPWATPLVRRTDVPKWLLDSPVYVTIRPQGIVDAGPVFPVEEFLPYEKCIPLLEKVARKVEAPVVAIFMGWEREGSWVYPESLPFVGGEESLRSFCREARTRGWHVGTFCNGTRWVVGHSWNGYDGRARFEEQGGLECTCREADGSPWLENWDRMWRPSYNCCLGSDRTRRMSVEYVRHLIDLGLESIQFLDQNNGAATFLCFSSEHGHPPAPGRWMTDEMSRFVGELRGAAEDAGEEGVIHSAESGINEFCLPLFQEAEIRLFPPGYPSDTVPLYQYLYHECIVFQGMMGNAPEPYHMPIRTAVNGVTGQLPGGVLTGDGTFLNKDCMNWAPWEKSGRDESSFEMLRTVVALRRGPAKEYLVMGRMLRPARVTGIRTVRWRHEETPYAIPAVFHSAWRAPDGRTGVVLANWTTTAQEVGVSDPRLLAGSVRVAAYLSGRKLIGKTLVARGGRLGVKVPSLGCVLLEGGRAAFQAVVQRARRTTTQSW